MAPDTDTYDAMCEVMDMVQRVKLMVAWLCEQAGIDPAEAARLPDEVPAIPVMCAKHNAQMTRDEPRGAWRCWQDGCTARLPDEEARRLRSEIRGTIPSIQVT